MITLDNTPEPGETYYRDHGWSGCAGSAWSTLTDAAKDGWRHAERLATCLAAAEARPTIDVEWIVTDFAHALHHALVEDRFRDLSPDVPIPAGYYAADSDQSATAARLTVRMTRTLMPFIHPLPVAPASD